MVNRTPRPTPDTDPLRAGVEAHRRGDLSAALSLYEKALRRTPNHPDALHLSGLALLGTGDEEAGLNRLRLAVASKPQETPFRLSLVRSLAQRRQWAEAAAAAADFARKHPGAEAAHCLLALANQLFDVGAPADALPLYRLAQPLAPDSLEAAHNAACCLRSLGRRDEAGRAFAAALLRAPAGADSLNEAAALALAMMAPRRAAVAIRRALLVSPLRADLAVALAAVRMRGGDAVGAWAACRVAAVLAPAGAAGWINGATALAALAQTAAVRLAERGVRSAADDPQAHANLGMALQTQLKLYEPARAAYRRAAALAPADPAVWRNLGTVWQAQGAYDAALSTLDRALIVADGAAEAAAVQSNRGVALMSVGRQGAAAAAFRAALDLAPDDLTARSNLLFCLCFDPDTPPETVYADHVAYERFIPVAASRAAASEPLLPAAPSDGRLRVGYVSPDFQRYPGPGFHFLAPLAAGCDRSRFSVLCYYNDAVHDQVTALFQASADQWRDIAGWSDARLAAQVAADGVDILVDAGGHMSRNRMSAFASRMAPIQVSFPLYPNTTGLSAMDYQFGDGRLTPPFMQAYRREALIRLPETTLCYRPAESAVTPPPFSPWEKAGVFTFACFNNLAKLDDATIAAWSDILAAAPRARLALKWRGLADSVAARFAARFAARGVGPERLLLLGQTPDPYEAYACVDLCLDPLFAAGGTTSCDALWMGAPVLTLAGRTVIGRWGVSLLTAVGLAEPFVTHSTADYIARAVAFANDPVALSAVRRNLRDRMQASPLMDETAYVRAVERAYVEIWRRRQAGEAPSPFDVADLPATEFGP